MPLAWDWTLAKRADQLKGVKTISNENVDDCVYPLLIYILNVQYCPIVYIFKTMNQTGRMHNKEEVEGYMTTLFGETLDLFTS